MSYLSDNNGCKFQMLFIHVLNINTMCNGDIAINFLKSGSFLKWSVTLSNTALPSEKSVICLITPNVYNNLKEFKNEKLLTTHYKSRFILCFCHCKIFVYNENLMGSEALTFSQNLIFWIRRILKITSSYIVFYIIKYFVFTVVKLFKE